jgi:hypothetical protein
VLVMAGAGLLLAIAHIATSTPKYAVRAVITSTDQPSAMSSIANLGRAFGFDLGGSSQENYYNEFLETLRSEDVAQELAKHGWLQTIYSSSWDAKCNCWREPLSPKAMISGSVKALFGREFWRPPSAYDLYNYIKKSIKVVPLTTGSMTELRFQYPDRAYGVGFLNDALTVADGLVRSHAVERAQSSRDYLTKRLGTTLEADYRQMLLQMLQQQEGVMMTVASRETFAWRPVVAPSASPDPVSPNIWLDLIVGVFAGALVGFCAAFVFAVREARNPHLRPGEPLEALLKSATSTAKRSFALVRSKARKA